MAKYVLLQNPLFVMHYCRNDCVLFYKKNEQASEYLQCGEPRYKTNNRKGKRIPHKVLRYFSLISRLQRLYMSTKIAKEMRWNYRQRVSEENILSHPIDVYLRSLIDDLKEL